MKVRAVIAEDEPVARAGLRAMLGAINWIDVVGEASNGAAAVTAIDTLKPDLVLLDIQMPGLLGTDVLRQCTHRPHAVFTTAYAQHAVTAFELGALDYLLKPFGQTRLESALERVRAALGEPVAHGVFERLGEALSRQPMSRLFVRTGGNLVPVALDTISWFEADGDYVIAHVGPTRHVVHVSLTRIEARIDPVQFVRLHRTCIVNMTRVRRFKSTGKGMLVAELDDGTQLPVSRTRAAELRKIAE